MSEELKSIKFQMMLAPSESERIDDWGFGRRIRSRAEAIRRLCHIGLIFEGSAPDLMKRNERALKALMLGLEKLSKADRDKLPKGIRAAFAVAIEEQLKAYRASVEAYVRAESLSAPIEDAATDDLLRRADEMLKSINWKD